MTNSWSVETRESLAQRRAESTPLSHLSIELGHLYFEEFRTGFDGLAAYFERIRPWVEAATNILRRRVPSHRPRVSTCFLVDDYFTRFSTPAEVLPLLIKAAESQNVTIDYIARECGCAVADGVPLADLVLDRIVLDPPPGSTGVRPPATMSGWLCNGQRSPDVMTGTAMSGADRRWQPPTENGPLNNHSIFLDVQLWDMRGQEKVWSCAYLAAIWQLLRLGLLRYDGQVVARPTAVEQFPDEWERLPSIVKINPAADPFSAYSTFSVLGHRFLNVEHAVRTILQQVNVEQVVADQVSSRAQREGLQLPAEVWQRIEYLFVADRD
ncbi:SCO2522 family protein [Actinoplanes sp. TRM 88003]|uniref:SCO2522 family protein n=1 Tax=Paractinoplanes aksuensis TaxID=2939490 RepID=A0ABT1DX31_9ACTN|nr:SCO2522 family protein [Actinoplanes aksuensis]MCO8275404.1 SCO2522 family protein [Actinoplanes aksuensis]